MRFNFMTLYNLASELAAGTKHLEFYKLLELCFVTTVAVFFSEFLFESYFYALLAACTGF